MRGNGRQPGFVRRDGREVAASGENEECGTENGEPRIKFSVLRSSFIVLLSALVPKNSHVLGRPADGDEIDPAVAIEVASNEIFDGDIAGIHNLP